MNFSERTSVITKAIELLRTSSEIDELNSAYNTIVTNYEWLKQETEDDTPLFMTDEEFLTKINLITNYNIVRIAYDYSQSEDDGLVSRINLQKCMDSVKEHPANHIENELLKSLS